MSPEQTDSPDFFDTPARGERLQLLLHLARNAAEVVYLRAPAGAGKTRFARRLIEHLDDEIEAIWFDAGHAAALPECVAAELGLPVATGEWPNAVLQAVGEHDMLLVVDGADRLEPSAVQQLIALHAAGGRLLLLGEGALAQPDAAWRLQFVDLPRFDAAQSAAFLRRQAGADAARITDDLAAAAHSASNGLPGPLLEALRGVLARPEVAPPSPPPPAPVAPAETPTVRRKSAWTWIAGGLIAAVLALLLVFQDQVNALLDPPEVVLPSEESAVEPPGEAADEPPAAPLAQQTIDAVVEPAGPDVAADDPPVVAPVEAVAEPIGELQRAGTGGVPPIALPELSRPSPDSDHQAVPPEVAAIAGEAGKSGGEAPADPIDPDPLDAVMQDALSAVAAQNTQADAGAPEAPRDQKPAATGPIPAEAVSAQAAAQQRVAVTLDVAEKASAGPAPVEERTSSRAADRPALAGSLIEAQANPGSRPVTAAAAGDRWLASRNPTHFTLQLVGARERGSVEKFVRDHAIQSPYAIFSRDLKGKPWYSLVAGDYPTRDAAIAARDRLPKALQGLGIWPRTFGSVKKVK